jgi:hypothetical protein
MECWFKIGSRASDRRPAFKSNFVDDGTDTSFLMTPSDPIGN